MSELRSGFVHGLSGWGSYDEVYRRMPYWGMRGGDLIAWLRGQGFDCYAASVAPTGNVWDRACELYAQLAGTRVDYFSVPCAATEEQPDGTHRPIRGMEPLFAARSCQMGAYTGTTASGMRVDESWRENDGMVNTSSAKVPEGAPWKPLDRVCVEPGLWERVPHAAGGPYVAPGGA